MHINSLPIELLLNIFQHLNSFDRIMILPEVCSLWKDITFSDINFLKNLYIYINCAEFFKPNVEPLINFHNKGLFVNKCGLTKVKHIKNVKIIGTPNETNNLQTILSVINDECKDIISLECHNCNGDITEQFIDLVHDFYPNIKRLSFLLSSSFLNKIPYNKIANFKHLKILMSDDHCFTDFDLFTLTEGKASISVLGIPCSHDISDYGLKAFLNNHKAYLEELYLSGYGITSESFMMIAQCPKLSILIIYDARRLKENELMELSKLPRLQCLLLQRATFSTKSLYEFLENKLKSNPKLFIDLRFYSGINIILKQDILTKFPTLKIRL